MDMKMMMPEKGEDLKLQAVNELLMKVRKLIMEMEMDGEEGSEDASETENQRGSNNEEIDAKLAADTEMSRAGAGGEATLEEKMPSAESDECDDPLKAKMKAFFMERHSPIEKISRRVG